MKTKILVAAFVAVMAIFGTFIFVQRTIIAPQFQALEKNNLHKQLMSVVHLFDRETMLLDRTCRDWAAWDASYDFLLNRDMAFIEENLGEGALEPLSLDLAVFCTKTGDVRWGMFLENGREADIASLGLLQNGKMPVNSSLFVLRAAEGAGNGRMGVMDTKKGPMIFSVREILLSDGTGDSPGYLLMGKRIHKKILVNIEEQAGTTFRFVYPYTAKMKKSEFFPKAVLPLFAKNEKVETTIPYLGVSGTPLFSIQVMPQWKIVERGSAVGKMIMTYAFILAVFIFSTFVFIAFLCKKE